MRRRTSSRTSSRLSVRDAGSRVDYGQESYKEGGRYRQTKEPHFPDDVRQKTKK